MKRCGGARQYATPVPLLAGLTDNGVELPAVVDLLLQAPQVA